MVSFCSILTTKIHYYFKIQLPLIENKKGVIVPLLSHGNYKQLIIKYV